MKSHEVVKLACKKKGAKNVAAHLNLALATLHRWSRPRGPKGTGLINPLDRIAAILEFTGEKQMVQWICQQAGGYFVANARVKVAAREEFMTEVGGVMCEMGHLQVALADGLRKKNVSPETAAKERKLWEELKSDMERYVKASESGDFATPKRGLRFAGCDTGLKVERFLSVGRD